MTQSMSNEDRKFLQEQFARIDERFDQIDERFDQVGEQIADLRREMDGRFSAMWREMNDKFREQNAHHRVLKKNSETILDLVSEQESKIFGREAAD